MNHGSQRYFLAQWYTIMLYFHRKMQQMGTWADYLYTTSVPFLSHRSRLDWSWLD